MTPKTILSNERQYLQNWTRVTQQYSPVPIFLVPNTPVSEFLSLDVSHQIVLGLLSKYGRQYAQESECISSTAWQCSFSRFISSLWQLSLSLTAQPISNSPVPTSAPLSCSAYVTVWFTQMRAHTQSGPCDQNLCTQRCWPVFMVFSNDTEVSRVPVGQLAHINFGVAILLSRHSRPFLVFMISSSLALLVAPLSLCHSRILFCCSSLWPAYGMWLVAAASDHLSCSSVW